MKIFRRFAIMFLIGNTGFVGMLGALFSKVFVRPLSSYFVIAFLSFNSLCVFSLLMYLYQKEKQN